MKKFLMAVILLILPLQAHATQVPAALVSSLTSSFTNCLNSSDINVQTALNDIDRCLGIIGVYTFADSLVNTSGTVTLVGDVSSPGNSFYYGTNSSGTRGWYATTPGGVTSFNTRTGAVTLLSADVTTALGYTPVQTVTASAPLSSSGGTMPNITFTNPGYITGVNWPQIGGNQQTVGVAGFNWQSLAGINTSNINWQSTIFSNFGVNWTNYQDIGAQNVNWYDLNLFLNKVSIGTSSTTSTVTVQAASGNSVIDLKANGGTEIQMDQFGNIFYKNGNNIGFGFDATVNNFALSLGGITNQPLYVTTPAGGFPIIFYPAEGAGNVGIDTTTPRGTLDTTTAGIIYGSTYNSSANTGSLVATTGLNFDPTGAGPLVSLTSGRYVGIGTTAPAYPVDTWGQVGVGGINFHYPNGINWNGINNEPPSAVNWTAAPGNTLGYVWTDTGTGANWQSIGSISSGVNWPNIGGSQLAVGVAGFNWQSMTGLNTSNINWQNSTFTNMGINWTTFKDLGSQTINWYDINIFLNQANANSFVGPLTGNSSTATALASTPTLCSSGQAPTGVNASGNAQGCTTYLQTNQSITLTGAVTGSGTTSIATTFANLIVQTGNVNWPSINSLQSLSAGTGINWADTYRLTSGTGINWNSAVFQQIGINWTNYKDIGAQNLNWYDISPILNSTNWPSPATLTGPGGGNINYDRIVCGNSTTAGSAVPTGTTPSLTFNSAGTIVSATISGALSAGNCSCTIDVWKTNAALPTVANTITASALPTLTSAKYHQDTTLTGWTTSVAANDVVMCNVNSCTCDNWNVVLGVKK